MRSGSIICKYHRETDEYRGETVWSLNILLSVLYGYERERKRKKPNLFSLHLRVLHLIGDPTTEGRREAEKKTNRFFSLPESFIFDRRPYTSFYRSVWPNYSLYHSDKKKIFFYVSSLLFSLSLFAWLSIFSPPTLCWISFLSSIAERTRQYWLEE